MHCRKQERAQNHTFPGPLQKRCLPKLCGSSGYLESVASIMERTTKTKMPSYLGELFDV